MLFLHLSPIRTIFCHLQRAGTILSEATLTFRET